MHVDISTVNQNTWNRKTLVRTVKMKLLIIAQMKNDEITVKQFCHIEVRDLPVATLISYRI